MDASTEHDGGREARPRARRRRAWPVTGSLVTGAAALALLVGGCGGDPEGEGKEVANVGPSGGSSAPANQGAGPGVSKDEVKKMALAYSQCMRKNGITEFPDPDSNGGLSIDAQKVQQFSPQFKKADAACKSLLPAPPAGGVPENRAAGLKYAKCMRENGVPKFPDPKPGGGIGIDGDKLGVDPAGPVFKNAEKKCQQHLAGGGKGDTQGSGPGGP
ncbi:hypothetical protein [Actinomadura rugatobispora]|uniref:Uncharacterized protein n=1 Tax=Actinomadura rugatobispora TaxID=1994 RepID=A0ABW1AHS6_9ACTN